MPWPAWWVRCPSGTSPSDAVEVGLLSDEEEAAWLLDIMGGGCDDDAALAHLSASMRQHYRERAARHVSDYWPAVLALADRMLTDPATLTYDEARRIVAELPCWPEYLR
jgi:hypothetical protein